MKILTFLTLMTATYFVARGDQHAGCASVIAADGRVWNNVRMEWTIASDLQLSDATGHRIATLPGKTTSYSYTTDSWYFGVFAWVFIAAVIGHGIYMPMDPANGGRPQFISDRGEMEAASLLCAIRESLPPFA